MRATLKLGSPSNLTKIGRKFFEIFYASGVPLLVLNLVCNSSIASNLIFQSF